MQPIKFKFLINTKMQLYLDMSLIFVKDKLLKLFIKTYMIPILYKDNLQL